MTVVLSFSNNAYPSEYKLQEKHDVLVIHSYPAYITWSETLQKKLNKINRELGIVFNFDVEYLDYSKRNDPVYIEQRINSLSAKQTEKGNAWKAIIAFDDFAASLVANNQDLISNKELKLFLLGVTDGLLDGIEIKNQHEISIDVYDYRRIIEGISSTKDNIDSLHLIVDDTSFGDYLYESIYPKIRLYFDFPIYVTRNTPISEVHEILKNKGENDVVLLGSYRLKNVSNGEAFYGDKIIDLISPNSLACPIYVLFDSYVIEGTLGGAVRSASKQAEHAMELLISSVVDGKSASNSQYHNSYSEFIFDYESLQEKNIDLSKVPHGATIVNKPAINAYNSHYLAFYLSVVVTLIIIIVVGKYYYLQKIQYQKALNLKNDEIRLAQQEIISMLGEVVETRSGETGNHIRRVSIVSGKLAQLLGMSDTDGLCCLNRWN